MGFSADVVVASIEGRGYGWVAMRDLPRGTIVLREAPIAALRASALHEYIDTQSHSRQSPRTAMRESQWNDAQWWPSATQASEDVIACVAELEFAKCADHEKQKWMSLADSFSTPPTKLPGNIIRSNAFTQVETGDNLLYEHMSRANHSCTPNMCRHFVGDILIASLTQDVCKGEEMVISYLSDSNLEKDTETRRGLLRSRFNFICTCERCEAEALTNSSPLGVVVPRDLVSVSMSPHNVSAQFDAGQQSSMDCKQQEAIQPAAAIDAATRALTTHLQVSFTALPSLAWLVHVLVSLDRWACCLVSSPGMF
jgi:hypothetical protein